MKNKGQQEIIVTVLLVLIALAAVALIATFVINQVRQGTQTAESKAECLKVTLFIDSANASSIAITRGNDDLNISKIKLFVNGKENTTVSISIPNALETLSSGISAKAGEKVRINPVIRGYTCENGVEATVTA